MKSIITLILVLLMFTNSHATDSTNTNYGIVGCETIPDKAHTYFDFSHPFQINDGCKLRNMDWHLLAVDEIPKGQYNIDNNGVFHFIPDPQDGGKSFRFKIEVNACEQVISDCEFSIDVVDEKPVMIQIQKQLKAPMGGQCDVNIYKIAGNAAIKEVDLFIGYDKEALSIENVFAEYLLEDGICSISKINNSTDSIQLLRIKASTKNVSPPKLAAALVRLVFNVTKNRQYIGFDIPINFYWTDCNQNYVVTEDNDTLYLMINEQKIHSMEDKHWSNRNNYLRYKYYHHDEFQKYPLLQQCFQDKEFNYIYYKNGGVRFFGGYWADFHSEGDLDLNGIKNEFADADLYSKYFLWGPSVLDITLDIQMAASDLNSDRIEASPADLVYLLKIISGEAFPYAWLKNYRFKVFASFEDGFFSTSADSTLGAVWVRFKPLGEYEIFNESDMILDYAESEGELKVLVWSGLDNLNSSIPCGDNELFRIEGDVELIAVEASDLYGNVVSVEME